MATNDPDEKVASIATVGTDDPQQPRRVMSRQTSKGVNRSLSRRSDPQRVMSEKAPRQEGM